MDYSKNVWVLLKSYDGVGIGTGDRKPEQRDQRPSSRSPAVDEGRMSQGHCALYVLQCFDTLGWVAGRASGLYKSELRKKMTQVDLKNADETTMTLMLLVGTSRQIRLDLQLIWFWIRTSGITGNLYRFAADGAFAEFELSERTLIL